MRQISIPLVQLEYNFHIKKKMFTPTHYSETIINQLFLVDNDNLTSSSSQVTNPNSALIKKLWKRQCLPQNGCIFMIYFHTHTHTHTHTHIHTHTHNISLLYYTTFGSILKSTLLFIHTWISFSTVECGMPSLSNWKTKITWKRLSKYIALWKILESTTSIGICYYFKKACIDVDKFEITMSACTGKFCFALSCIVIVIVVVMVMVMMQYDTMHLWFIHSSSMDSKQSIHTDTYTHIYILEIRIIQFLYFYKTITITIIYTSLYDSCFSLFIHIHQVLSPTSSLTFVILFHWCLYYFYCYSLPSSSHNYRYCLSLFIIFQWLPEKTINLNRTIILVTLSRLWLISSSL